MLKTLLDQFKGLNPKDPGAWPPLPKVLLLLVLFIGLLVGAYFLDWSDQLEQLDAGVAQEAKLNDEYKNKKQKSINLDLYRQQLREIDSSFGALLKQLPNRSQMDALLVDINQADIGGLSRIVTLNDLALSGGKGGALTLDATAKTFRYLDEEEVASQRRATAQKGAKRGRK